MIERFVSFDCRGDSIAAILHEPNVANRKGVGLLMIVGGPQYRVGSHRQFVQSARTFAQAGYPVMRFDYRGMGDSEGQPRTFESVDADITCAIAALRSMTGIAKVMLFGLCDAASAAMMYVKDSKDDGIVALMLLNPWARTESGQARAYVEHYYRKRLLQRTFWRKVFSGDFDFAGSLRSLLGAFKKSRQGAGASKGSGHFTDRMYAGVKGFSGSIAIVLSGNDLTAHEFEAYSRATPGWSEIFRRSSVTELRMPVADHTFSGTGSRLAADHALLDWIAREVLPNLVPLEAPS